MKDRAKVAFEAKRLLGVHLDQPRAGEVLVEIMARGICPYPAVLHADASLAFSDKCLPHRSRLGVLSILERLFGAGSE